MPAGRKRKPNNAANTSVSLRRSRRLMTSTTTTAVMVSKDENEEKPKRKKTSNKKTQKSTASAQKSTKKELKLTTKNNKTKKRTTTTKDNDSSSSEEETYLPRTRELSLLEDDSNNDNIEYVFGIDEAGRGPLAGPVVAAAAYVPTNIPGIVDSKKITKEEKREELYEKIISSPNAIWCACIIDAQRIDEINILQATMEGMKFASYGLISSASSNNSLIIDNKINIFSDISVDYKGCYIVCGKTNDKGELIPMPQLESSSEKMEQSISSSSSSTSLSPSIYYSLVDGNRIPTDMPCNSEFIIKGDSKEYAIAAASIVAKVTRDRLMNEYDKMYPLYNLSQHKGYPTAAHMSIVKEHGATPIHRRTFAPLKYMTFDENGKIINSDDGDDDNNDDKKKKKAKK